jgi:Proto-chlorophyllide reductase 57 kD subunit
MKFLCVLCDEAMKLDQVERPGTGSLSVVFACATCGHRMAMLTNPGETQLLRALDVRIGGRSAPAEPLEFVRSMLDSQREAGQDAASPGVAGSAAVPTSGCPFSAMANLAAVEVPACQSEAADRPSAEPGVPGTRHRGTQSAGSLGTPNVPVAESPDRQIAWSPEAARRLERIPEFIRPMVRQGIERLAAQRGLRQVTEDVMDEARSTLGL